jgi:FkbM family methyltransferase
MRTWWGKLISIELLRQCDFEKCKSVSYGADTMFAMEVFRIANRVEVLAESLHKYYVSGVSVSYKWDEKRIVSDRILDDAARAFLLNKCGEVSPQNNEFLLIVYFNAIKDTLKVLLNAQISVTEKIAGLRDIFTSENTQNLIAWQDCRDEKKQMFNTITDYLQSQADAFDAENGAAVVEICAAMDRFDCLRLKSPLLKTVTPESATFLSAAVAAVLRDDLQSALDEIFKFAEDEIPDEYAASYLDLAQNICAVAEYADGFVLFKKQWASWLIEQNRHDEARSVAAELAEMLPDDEDVKAILGNITPPPTHSGIRTGCDDEFYTLINRLKAETLAQLLISGATCASAWKQEDKEYHDLLLKWYQDWYSVTAFSVQDQGFLNYFGGVYNYLKTNADALCGVYESLADYRSKLTLNIIVQHWFTFHPDLRKSGTESLFSHYFDLDVRKCDENEVFVDCGCYIGDTVQDFIKQYGNRYKSIYSYELTPSTYEIAKRNLKDVKRLYLRNAGVSNTNGTLRMVDSIDAGNRIVAGGNVTCKVVRIDDDISENITFIKMDVEGAEIDALLGAEQQIRCNKPKMAISLYHKFTDLLEIPQLVNKWVPGYKLYLQHSGMPDFPFPTEYVLLAVAED